MDGANHDEAARKIHAYLAVRDLLPASPVDVVIGFGHFDLGIPRRCAELVQQGCARRIIFTGGVGVGSGDFTQPEAREFVDELRRTAPETVAAVACIEDRSTNTGENVQFLRALLEKDHPELMRGLRTVLVVATPARQRRTMLTIQRHWPELRVINAPSDASFEKMAALYASKREDWRAQLTGEIDRLLAYPARGFIAPVNVPPEIVAASEWVKRTA